jgi:ribosomal protein S18
MPEEKGGSGIAKFVQGVYTETTAKAQKRLADAIVLGVVAMTAAIVKWVAKTPDAWLIILGAVLVILLRVVVLFVIGLWRYSQRKPAEVELMAAPESVHRLREVYSSSGPSLQYALWYFSEIVAKPTTREQELLARALQEFLMEGVERAKGNLDGGFQDAQSRPLTARELTGLSEHFAKVMTTWYPKLLTWIYGAGQAIVGDSLTSSKEYRQLYDLHARHIEAIQRVRDRTDIGTAQAWQRMLAQTLPAPGLP